MINTSLLVEPKCLQAHSDPLMLTAAAWAPLPSGQHLPTEGSLLQVGKRSARSKARQLVQGKGMGGAAMAGEQPLVPSHAAYGPPAKAVDQQGDARFRRTLGFPPPFSTLPLTGELTCSLVFFEECLPLLSIPRFPSSTPGLCCGAVLCLHSRRQQWKQSCLCFWRYFCITHITSVPDQPNYTELKQKGKKGGKGQKKEWRDIN